MSFILDALKKSETERQRQNTPGIADVPRATEQSTVPRWIWILGALLAINTLVLIGLVVRPDRIASDAVQQQAQPVESERQLQQPGASSFSDLVAEAKRSQPAPVPETPGSSQPPAGTSTQADDDARTVANQIAVTQTSDHPSVSDGLQSLNDLRASGVLQLPDLHLDIHVYAKQPADRFVFVNMSKYKEGALLSEGPLVQEITPDGVILDQSGTRFLLPRE